MSDDMGSTIRILGDGSADLGWDKLSQKLVKTIIAQDDVNGWFPVGFSLNVIYGNADSTATRIANRSSIIPPDDEGGHAQVMHSIGWALVRVVTEQFQDAIDDAVSERADESSP